MINRRSRSRRDVVYARALPSDWSRASGSVVFSRCPPLTSDDLQTHRSDISAHRYPPTSPLCFRALACRPRVMAAYKLVLIRHGESCWNQENRFCGWFDADLSETGAEEAKRGGQALKGERSPVLCLCGAWGDPRTAAAAPLMRCYYCQHRAARTHLLVSNCHARNAAC